MKLRIFLEGKCSPAEAIARLLLLCLLWPLGFHGAEARAQGSGVSEYEVKAAFLVKFPGFVKWPSASGASITVGILGDDPFGGALDKLTRVKRSRRAEDLKGCPIVFVSKSEQANLGAVLASLGRANVLTVGESAEFAKQGGMIGFVMNGDKVRFEVNTRAARQAGLVIDVGLLKLAQRVFSE